MGSGAKQHHYIPISYSANFANDEGYLFVRDNWTGKIFPTKPENALKQGYLYSQPVHAEMRLDNSIEDFFSRTVETSWPSIVTHISGCGHVDKLMWGQIIKFMLSMRVRVPNTMKAVLHLLKSSIIDLAERSGEALPASLVDKLSELRPDIEPPAKFGDLVDAGLIHVNVDPHTAIISFEKLIKNSDLTSLLTQHPTFLHNATELDFLSSDNPVIYQALSEAISSPEPYSFNFQRVHEVIFPINSRVCLLFRTDKTHEKQHKFVHSTNTINKLNNKINKYSDRYIFSRSEENITKYVEGSDIAPVPMLGLSRIGSGIVHKISYKWGPPLQIRNKWKYDFERG